MGAGFDYAKWYEENSEEISRKRKSRYHRNKVYQEEQKERATINYWKKRIAGTDFNPEKLDIDKVVIEDVPHGLIDIRVTNRKDVRYGETVEVPVYTISAICNIVERTPQTIRGWERKGIIPKVTLKDYKGMRLFTEDQVKIYARNKPLLEVSLNNLEESVFSREIHKDYRKLRNNLIPIVREDYRT